LKTQSGNFLKAAEESVHILKEKKERKKQFDGI